ncbi:MAG: S-layer homology domain-containing protein [Eubacteriales bacterium]|nr:S-layer homology domain-containing protein [Eubacteriales bacterium]
MKKIIIFISAILLMSCICVSAEENSVRITKIYSSNEIEVRGTAAANEAVTVQILKDDKNLSNSEILSDFSNCDNPEEMIVYTGDCVADENGGYAFRAGIAESGNFVLYIFNQSEISDYDFSFINSEDYLVDVEYVNLSSDKDEFMERLGEKLDALGLSQFDFDGAVTDKAAVIGLVYDNMGESRFDKNDSEKNNALYKKCVAMIAVNSSTVSNVTEYLSDIYLNDTVLKKYWESHIDTEEKEIYLTKKMQGKNITTMEKLEKTLKEAIVLTVVKYPNGYKNIQNVFNDFKDVLGLSSVSSQASVYKTLADASEFSDIDALLKKYKSLVESTGSSGSSSGGGGGSSSSGGQSMNNSYSYLAGEAASVTETAGELKLKFVDLENVMWAYPAISVLYEEGIVSGVSETEFLPEYNVTREEFVKLLITAMDCDQAAYGANKFSDVSENDWFCRYVNIANDLQIVKGVGDGKFGAGSYITRQDMSVMLVNALKYKGVKMTQSDFMFDDADMIEEYAKEAISCLYEMGIVNGVSETEFGPKELASRAQAAKIIYEALDKLR